MSTKSTIKHGDTWHLFFDLADPHSEDRLVHLDLDKVTISNLSTHESGASLEISLLKSTAIELGLIEDDSTPNLPEGRINGFIDLKENENLINGLEYRAAGIITAYYAPSPSGKDYIVRYMDPWGKVIQGWRAINEIRIQPLSESDYALLEESLNEASRKNL